MSDATETEKTTSGEADRSEMDPVKVQPGSKADPSTKADWNDHVKEYFNEDATPGEAAPTASHEAKE